MDWKISDLEKWDNKVCQIANSFNLDWFPINYEICDYYEMIGHMSYHGLPSHYPHWSYGKSFERTHQMYNLGVEGLPYELIINSPGHISVGDLLSSLRSILKPLGLTPILECNRVLDLNECFFGFKFLLPLNQSEFQEDPILEEECQQQQQTIYPRMQDE